MCAIHGIFWPSKEAMAKMIEQAHHRGPDGNGQWNDEHITLGHNLLSIVDEVKASSQPWFHNDYVLIYNGEIYNYKELQSTINHQFKTNTDTEVLIAGIEQYGKSFIHKLDGMYAFACYNKKTKKLIIARDSNGAKPFYYCNFNNRFVFSSEIKSILSLGFPRKVSKEGFKHYYNTGLIAGYLTLFNDINKLVPGEIIEIDVISNIKQSTNVNNDRTEPFKGFEKDIPDLLREKLKKAVEMTLMGRKEIGLFLSGGIDSSSVFYELVHSSKTKPNTFSTRFIEPNNTTNYNDDADKAKMLSEKFNSNHKEIIIGEQEWIDNLEKCILALEEPRQGKSFPAYYATNKLLSDNGITVTLSGDGGDELLAGYKHHLFAVLDKKDKTYKRKLEMLRSGHRVLKNKDLNINVDQQWEYLKSWLPKGKLTGDTLNDFLYIECLQVLSEDFLIRNDKLGMAFSMEARFPMMCNVFRDFVRSLPGSAKVNQDFLKKNYTLHNKHLLRKAYKNKLPDSIVNKIKSGWRAPTDHWIIGTKNNPSKDNSPLKNYFRTVLNNKEIMNIFEYNKDEIENRYLNNKNFEGHLKKGGPGIGLSSQKELFIIIMFGTWYKLFKMNM
jgi:asparagine synthase (glutamine-hydrolysing)